MTARKAKEKTAPEPGLSPPGTADSAASVAKATIPIVGLGASAGGLAAFEAFFSGMPADADPGMAFVLVQHLAPDHKSILADLIRRYTRMQVFEVEDGMPVAINCAYIIPPNRQMAFLNGKLELLNPSEPRGQRLPIDFFFRSLAHDQRERAIGIVLSGTGSDGTQGVRAIKGEGGMVMAQSPDSTEFDGMPRSAIATGLVDWELPPAQMAAQLVAYVAHAFGRLPRLPDHPAPRAESALKKIFILLRAQTGHDFSQYKPSSIHRRILRRMSVHQIEALDGYVRYLQQTPAEVDSLFQDLLIGVTSFFRDPEAFAVLEEQIIPRLFADQPAGGVIRVWSTGCSTGEEAYSLAILLQEHMESLRQRYTLQVFATDIDSRAIATARAGIFPAGIAADVSSERLARWFTAEPGGSAYRIHKGIRDLLVFSEHDLLKDPPFSRLDLLSCRNLLIYLNADLQKQLATIFHYALNPGGVLFLGTSESPGGSGDLFAVLDRKAKLYQRKNDVAATRHAYLRRFLPPMTTLEQPGKAKTAVGMKVTLRDLTEQALLQQVAPAAALVNGQGDILYLHGRTGAYLEPAPGESGINNIVKMARDGLQFELTASLHRAGVTRETVHARGLQVRTNGDFTRVNLSIHPLTTGLAANPGSPLYLVILAEAPGVDPEVTPGSALPFAVAEASGRDADAQISALREEMRAKDEYLQNTHEELETANEELKSTNEEMQSVNEELQSTNEELETSKEELQSVNEELATVNAELRTKVEDLSRANNDMNNLLAGTGIATIFVDHQQHILRFTPATSQIINLIPRDAGRPVGHIVSNLVGYDRLAADVQGVIETLTPMEAQVQTTGGLWYVMRIRPYRTQDNVIEGAVITFVDITEMKRVQALLESSNTLFRLGVVVRDAFDAITVQGLDGRILAWNPGAERIYGWTEAEALLMNACDRIPQGLQDEAPAMALQLGRAEALTPRLTRRLTRNGTVVHVWLTASALVGEAGVTYAIATTERPNKAMTDVPLEASP